ncbi:MAG: glycosyltransferase [Polyangiaceae bacterium]
MRHVPFGVDVPRVPEERRAARRAELTLGRPGPLLVGVGRFAVEKRWDVVLEASRRLLPTWPHTLVLFGDGPERTKLERAAGPHVRFLGFEKDRERLFSGLAAGDALVHGCPCETFGLSIAEALTAGLPVVVPRAGGAFDLADPTVSETYEPLDASACAAAVRRLLRRDREELGRAARAFAGTLPSHEGEIDALRALYTDLLGARPAPRLASRNPRM